MKTSQIEEIDAQLVRDLFEYDAESGTLIRKPCVGTRWLPSPITHSRDPRGYLKAKVRRRDYFVHRLVWLYVHGSWPVHEIDHVNRNPGDNRLENLRDVPRVVNLANRRSWAKLPKKISKPKRIGSVEFVKACRSKPYRARIVKNDQKTYLGYFATPEEAWAAIDAHVQSTGRLTVII